MPEQYDAILVLSFGGPEKREDVIPFLENVLRGRNVPRERMLAVAEHYYHFSGRSPINDQTRALIAALSDLLASEGPHLPIYWGNRNWLPLLEDTVRRMASDGVKRALAFVTSAYNSYSGCRQYLEDIDRARAAIGPAAPEIHKLRAFYNHPGFVEPMAERVQAALDGVPENRRAGAHLAFTAHSIPISMANSSDYGIQIHETCGLIAEKLHRPCFDVVYQSRSGAPGQPWLEPDVLDYLRGLQGSRDLVLAPVGFISDHMEVVYDLDYEAAALCADLGINMVRALTVGTHPAFIRMIRELILERISGEAPRSVGECGPSQDFCAKGCCPAPQRPITRQL